ncbi:MAG: transcriptional regulator TyrR, partial [Citrobacter freundii]|nr:transcriptional regulator TyrR [Citrobacter freundii]
MRLEVFCEDRLGLTRELLDLLVLRSIDLRASEREHLALSALLEALPEPVLSLDMKSKVEMANPASCQLFAHTQDRMRNHTAAQLINGFNFQRWLESNPQDSQSEHVVINGQNFLMEITPVHLQGENQEQMLTGAVVMLRSTIRMGRQLQNMTTQDLSAFSQIIAVSAKMKHVVEQARKLA